MIECTGGFGLAHFLNFRQAHTLKVVGSNPVGRANYSSIDQLEINKIPFLLLMNIIPKQIDTVSIAPLLTTRNRVP
ncbi:MAG: hypothetical protein HN644_00905 [Rhodospirillales bacterium]|jgi:hypothetical protein|nr:hypothetical protein [Rhodospirillales bacterium]MBT4038534.1 hypothetical protein [Rhodospirillales bacterium]MBT7145730.1 hypothetical protein [Rhodospirillales bacterium]MBT7504808.1 hypothetical protein [Rhodospirillales bacterium]